MDKFGFLILVQKMKTRGAERSRSRTISVALFDLLLTKFAMALYFQIIGPTPLDQPSNLFLKLLSQPLPPPPPPTSPTTAPSFPCPWLYRMCIVNTFQLKFLIMPFHNQTQNSEISKRNQPKNKINIFVRKKTNINEKNIYI